MQHFTDNFFSSSMSFWLAGGWAEGLSCLRYVNSMAQSFDRHSWTASSLSHNSRAFPTSNNTMPKNMMRFSFLYLQSQTDHIFSMCCSVLCVSSVSPNSAPVLIISHLQPYLANTYSILNKTKNQFKIQVFTVCDLRNDSDCEKTSKATRTESMNSNRASFLYSQPLNVLDKG